MLALWCLPFAAAFLDQLFQQAQFVQPQKLKWPKGVKNEIGKDMAWLKGTEWYWNTWRNVKFLKDGKFEAPTQDCMHMGMCEWAAYNGKIYIMWGDSGLHTLIPSQMVTDQSQEKLKKTKLEGKRKRDGDKITATFVKIFDFEAYLVEKDLYGALEVDDEADSGTIKRAYRSLSKEFHPDKNPSEEGKQRFNDVRDAYEILNNPETKILYDTGGMEAIHEHKKGQVQKGETSNQKAAVTLDMLYNGAEHPISLTRRVVCRGCATDPNKPKCKGCNRCPNEVRTVLRTMGPGFQVQQQEEVQSDQMCKNEQQTLDMHVERGMKDGETITFEMMGEQRPKMIPGDVAFKLKCSKHKVFTRKGNDLVMQMTISLRQSMLGFTKTISHLDDHEVKITRQGITKPGATMTVSGEGMPIQHDSASFGNLLIEFTVDYPDQLTSAQITAIAAAFETEQGDIITSAGSKKSEL